MGHDSEIAASIYRYICKLNIYAHKDTTIFTSLHLHLSLQALKLTSQDELEVEIDIHVVPPVDF